MTLHVMTFNIRQFSTFARDNRWDDRKDHVFDVISSRGPHVLAAQEVHKQQLEALLDRFPTFGVIAQRRYGGVIGMYAPIFFDAERIEAAERGDFWLAADPDGGRR